jgi:dynein heavy chain 1
METESEYKMTYKNILNKFQNGIKLLEFAYNTIENVLQHANEYIKTWLNFQSLWDLQPDILYQKLGNNLQAWMNCLNEMKESRAKSVDTQESHRLFGPISVDYTKVQSKVNVKYDAWHKDVLSKFGSLLGNEMNVFYSHNKSRNDLEGQSVEASSTSEAVSVITFVQSLKRKLKDWGKKVECFGDSQKVLERQRYQFPINWLDIQKIGGEWGAFNEILKRKDASIQNQVASLQAKIMSEEKIVESKTSELLNFD